MLPKIDPLSLQTAYQQFLEAYPTFESTHLLDELRASEYARLVPDYTVHRARKLEVDESETDEVEEMVITIVAPSATGEVAPGSDR